MAETQKFNIGDRVYYVLPSGTEGMIFDISYSFRYEVYKYHVIWNADNDGWYLSDELVSEKPVI